MVLDIKKALDSVSQEVLCQLMLKRGLPFKLVEYITASIKATNLIIGDTPIRISGRGVKQGDPLSPVWFNFTFNTALFHLDASPAGLLSSADFNHLVYVDDTIWLICRIN